MWSMPKAAFESDATQKYMKAPGSGKVDIPLSEAVQPEGVNVVSEDDRFRGVATVGGEVVRKDMDEELAYQLTKAVLDNLDAIKAKTPFLPQVSLGEVADTATTGMCGAKPPRCGPRLGRGRLMTCKGRLTRIFPGRCHAAARTFF